MRENNLCSFYKYWIFCKYKMKLLLKYLIFQMQFFAKELFWAISWLIVAIFYDNFNYIKVMLMMGLSYQIMHNYRGKVLLWRFYVPWYYNTATPLWPNEKYTILKSTIRPKLILSNEWKNIDKKQRKWRIKTYHTFSVPQLCWFVT